MLPTRCWAWALREKRKICSRCSGCGEVLLRKLLALAPSAHPAPLEHRLKELRSPQKASDKHGSGAQKRQLPPDKTEVAAEGFLDKRCPTGRESQQYNSQAAIDPERSSTLLARPGWLGPWRGSIGATSKPAKRKVQVRAHIFLQSVNVIRNIDYLTRCIKTEARTCACDRIVVMLHHWLENLGRIRNGKGAEAAEKLSSEALAAGGVTVATEATRVSRRGRTKGLYLPSSGSAPSFGPQTSQGSVATPVVDSERGTQRVVCKVRITGHQRVLLQVMSPRWT